MGKNLSVAIITRNEEANLPRTLGSVHWANEIVVVDCGSTDGTVELAWRFGAKVLQQDWLGFGPQKNLAIEYCSNEWVLSLDADEEVSETLAQEVASSNVKIQAVLPGATRTEIWNGSGVELHQLPSEIVMEVEDMVDAALAGFDQGELVTIPSLPDAADWQRLVAARTALLPNLSHKNAAGRYKTAAQV